MEANEYFENGETVEEIKLKSISGDSISLSSLRGNLVLVQFWAAWCLPCRIENKELTKIYAKYQNKKLTDGGSFKIFSVSLDEDTMAWKQAMVHDSMIWNEHMNLRSKNLESLRKFNLESIPSTYLISKEGKIIGINLAPYVLENILKKRMK